jgi:crotonobetainyl-CoA:carnitine CoA-transferase CaiB-like acyl-CoA transferase
MEQAPLAGIRVLELGTVLAGPYAGALLQRLGADVVKVESPAGDPLRTWGKAESPHFVQFNSGKKSLAIDLRDPRGIEALKRMLPSFDVLLHNSRPGRMERLGLSSDECLALNPRLVWAGLTGFGTVGPLASRPAYDTIAQASAGLFDALAPDGSKPVLGPLFGDMISGIVAAMGVLTALVSRERTGRGVAVETSMLEAVVALIVEAFTQRMAWGQTITDAERRGISQAFFVAGSDGQFLAIHLSNGEKFFQNFVAAMGLDDVAADPRFATYAARREHFGELVEVIEPLFADRPVAEWAELLVAADVPCTPVYSLAQVLEHPHISTMELFDDDGSGVALLRAPWTFDGVRPGVVAGVPRIGEHSREVLAASLPEDEVDALIADGVVKVAGAQA